MSNDTAFSISNDSIMPAETRGVPVEDGKNARIVPQPGRDLAVFLMLLVLLDVSGLLHVYGLSGLYAEEFFFGLGVVFVLLAFGLVLWPNQPVKWLRAQTPHGVAVLLAWLSVVAVLAAVAIWQVLSAVEIATDAAGVPVTTPISEQQKLVLIGLTAMVIIAFRIAYVRLERRRRRGLTLAAGAWFGVAVWSLVSRIESMPGGGALLSQIGTLCGCLFAALGIVALVGLAKPFPPGRFLVVALVVGAGLRLLAFGQLPININMNIGDMLPLVNASTERLLGGHSPYYVYQMPYSLPLTYWPLNLLMYLPFRAWDLDLRYANLLFGLVVGGILLWLRASVVGKEPGWACYAFGVLYVTPTMFTWDLVTAAPPFWMWLSILMAVIVWDPVPDRAAWVEMDPTLWERIRAVTPGAALGAAFAAGPLVLPFASTIALWWLRRGGRYLACQLGAAAVIGALVVLPFALANFGGFWLGAVSWFNDLALLPRSQWDLDRSWLHEVGLAGQFWKVGLEGWLKPLQFLVLGGVGIASWQKLRAPADVLRWGSAAYVLFMALNPVIWPYLYTPTLLGLVFTMAARGRNMAESNTAIGKLITQQYTEPGLPKVVIGGQSVGDAPVLHDDEGSTVC